MGMGVIFSTSTVKYIVSVLLIELESIGLVFLSLGGVFTASSLFSLSTQQFPKYSCQQ
jgi:hypothetical protein